jgi:protein O-GlcNAc transferase
MRAGGAPLSTAEELQRATELHQQGLFAEAERAYAQILAQDARHFVALHRLAIVALQQGRLDEALRRVEEALDVDPDAVSALMNQGTILLALKRHEEALATYRKVLARDPADAEAHFNLGNALLAACRPADAAQSFAQAHSRRPGDVEILRRQADALTKADRLHEAIEILDRAIIIDAGALRLHHDRAAVLIRLQRHQEVIAAYDAIIARDAHDTVALNNRGLGLLQLGRPREALASFDAATAIKAHDAELWHNRGLALSALQQIDAAVASYEKTLAINPDHVLALINRGNLLAALNRTREALTCYERALQIEPDNCSALNNCGKTLSDLNRPEAALACYDRAIAANPRIAVTHSNRGSLLNFLGRTEEAMQSLQRARELEPAALEYAISTHLLLPVLPLTLEEIAASRTRYQAGIAALMNAPGSLQEPGSKLTNWCFHLAYHNCNDRPIMESLCRLFRSRVPKLNHTAPHVPGWRPSEVNGRRIRLGFLSEFFVDHTIGRLYRGLLQHFDRSRFEVVLIHAPKARRDAFSRGMEAGADQTLILPAALASQQALVGSAQLDILFYPDIGMSASTYFLAYSRLAPIQMTSWGHPVTTGLETIDYFVSAKAVEPDDAQQHYTERLVRLDRMPCCYPAPPSPAQLPPRAALGLPIAGTLYGCPQSLFKIHPDFDAVLADIATGDPTAHIIFVEGLCATWKQMLQDRWRHTFPILLGRVVFLPRMTPDRFLDLLAHMDVLLDPLHFGSGNSMYEAMAIGTPIVTWAGNFMRGRIVAGAFRQMGLADAPIARHLKDYAPLALALGQSPQRRRAMRQATVDAARRELFDDMRAVRELEGVLEKAIAMAGRSSTHNRLA